MLALNWRNISASQLQVSTILVIKPFAGNQTIRKLLLLLLSNQLADIIPRQVGGLPVVKQTTQSYPVYGQFRVLRAHFSFWVQPWCAKTFLRREDLDTGPKSGFISWFTTTFSDTLQLGNLIKISTFGSLTAFQQKLWLLCAYKQPCMPFSNASSNMQNC